MGGSKREASVRLWRTCHARCDVLIVARFRIPIPVGRRSPTDWQSLSSVRSRSHQRCDGASMSWKIVMAAPETQGCWLPWWGRSLALGAVLPLAAWVPFASVLNFGIRSITMRLGASVTSRCSASIHPDAAGQTPASRMCSTFTRAGQTRDTRRVVRPRRRQQSHIGAVVCERDGDALCRLAASSPARRRLGTAGARAGCRIVSCGLGYASTSAFTAMFARRSARPRVIISLIQPVEPWRLPSG